MLLHSAWKGLITQANYGTQITQKSGAADVLEPSFNDMHTLLSFIKRPRFYRPFGFCLGVVLFFLWFYVQDQWGRQVGIFPNMRRSYEHFGLSHAEWEPIFTAGGIALYNFVKILFGIALSFWVWFTTTHFLTKGVETSESILFEKQGDETTYKFLIRNSDHKKFKNETIKKITDHLFEVFDINIYGRIRILLPECKNYQYYCGYDHVHENQISIELCLINKYHALIKISGIRILNIKALNSDEVIQKLENSLCKCPPGAGCRQAADSRHDLIKELKIVKNINPIGILELLKIYKESHVEFIALVTGHGTLRKKPIKSKEYIHTDFESVHYYYENKDRWVWK